MLQLFWNESFQLKTKMSSSEKNAQHTQIKKVKNPLLFLNVIWTQKPSRKEVNIQDLFQKATVIHTLSEELINTAFIKNHIFFYFFYFLFYFLQFDSTLFLIYFTFSLQISLYIFYHLYLIWISVPLYKLSENIYIYISFIF